MPFSQVCWVLVLSMSDAAVSLLEVRFFRIGKNRIPRPWCVPRPLVWNLQYFMYSWLLSCSSTYTIPFPKFFHTLSVSDLRVKRLKDYNLFARSCDFTAFGNIVFPGLNRPWLKTYDADSNVKIVPSLYPTCPL